MIRSRICNIVSSKLIARTTIVPFAVNCHRRIERPLRCWQLEKHFETQWLRDCSSSLSLTHFPRSCSCTPEHMIVWTDSLQDGVMTVTQALVAIVYVQNVIIIRAFSFLETSLMFTLSQSYTDL